MASKKSKTSDSSSGCGSSLVYLVGVGLAGASSWALNHSIGWAIVHGIFSWWYLLYLCMGCGGGLPHQIF